MFSNIEWFWDRKLAKVIVLILAGKKQNRKGKIDKNCKDAANPMCSFGTREALEKGQ
jgi:hypothetical protein